MVNVNDETILGDILKMPNGAEILSKYKLPCMGCPMAALEMGILKLGDVCRMYGIDKDSIVRELNSGGDSSGEEQAGDKPSV